MEKEYIDSLQVQFMENKAFLQSLINQVKENKVSNYPIFVATQSLYDIDLGLPVINLNEMDLLFQINLSHLEDFVNKGVVLQDKVKPFIENYKNHPNHFCVFAVEENSSGHFVFLPISPKADLPKAQLN